MGQLHIHDPKEAGPANLVNNLRNAIQAVTGDVVVVVEDDDHYSPDHVAVCLQRLEGYQAAGCRWLNYYNVQFKAWRRIRNRCAALCNTAFHVKHLGLLSDACDEAERRGEYHVDRFFWNRVRTRGNLHDEETVTGIKGIAGSVGIGIGHRPSGDWHPDPDGSKLREWIGEDARHYG